jgi:hypothetical protein
MNTVDVDRLRKLAISWRWWAATQCTVPGDRPERVAWRTAARELERVVGLDPPPWRVVLAPNSTPTHRCPVCGSPYWWCDGPPPQCTGRGIPVTCMDIPGVDLPKDFCDRHPAAAPVEIADGAELPPWNPEA